MYRLKKYKQGWIVEYKNYKPYFFFGIKPVWKYITHYAGMPDKPFYYKTAEGASQGALDEIKDQINFSFHSI